MEILFRTDSSTSIGLGHVMRCLVLAQRLHEEDKHLNISFATQNLSGNINAHIVNNSFTLHVLHSNKKAELINLLSEKSINLLIVDSYEISSKYEKKLLQKISCKTLFFDDTFKKHYSNIVLNHGIQVKKHSYTSLLSQKTKLFCGSKTTLLRDEFFKSFPKTTHKNRVAIFLGGNDVKNLSLKIAMILKTIDVGYKITIITTSSNQNIDLLKKNKSLTLLVDINNIAEILSQHSFIISASGGSLFEIMALQKRFINIEVATNQRSIVNFLEEKSIFTTIDIDSINKKALKNKIDYIMNTDIYQKLDLKFSKDYLAKKILKEIA